MSDPRGGVLLERWLAQVFQEPAPNVNDAADIRIHTTSTLKTSIATTSTPDIEGTRGFYVASESSGKLYFLTCRHVIFPFNSVEENLEYKYTEHSRLRRGIIQPYTATLGLLRENGTKEIKDSKKEIKQCLRWLGGVEKQEGYEIEKKKKLYRFRIQSCQKRIEDIKSEILALSHWEDPSNRVIGHAVYSPPLSAGTSPQGYTLDVCVCEVDQSRLDTKTFLGNVVTWGNSTTSAFGHGFKFPLHSGLQRLDGLTPVEEMINLKTKSLSDNGDVTGCLVVSKRGETSGVRFGKANNLPSLRTYFATGPNAKKLRALEWGIFRHDPRPNSEIFKKYGRGDSGATVFDNEGRILGLLTGWSGTKFLVDITYAMPAEFVVEEISKRWQKVHSDVLERV